MEPEDLTVIGHIGDLLVDIYTAKCGAYLHFTVVLNDGGKGAQSRRNGCSICAVEVRNLARNTQAAKKVEACIEETLTYCDFPSEHWEKIRTNKFNWYD